MSGCTEPGESLPLCLSVLLHPRAPPTGHHACHQPRVLAHPGLRHGSGYVGHQHHASHASRVATQVSFASTGHPGARQHPRLSHAGTSWYSLTFLELLLLIVVYLAFKYFLLFTSQVLVLNEWQGLCFIIPLYIWTCFSFF